MQAGLKVEILSPTQQMLTDFGVERAYLNGSHSTERVLPNDNLMYQDTRQINSVNVQDANSEAALKSLCMRTVA